jgi:Ca-activated chloride channel family protein
LLLLARVKSKPVGSSGRAPLNVSVVIDRSPSMEGNRLPYVKNAAQLIPQYLSAADIFSLVTFAGDVDTLLPPQPVLQKDFILYTIQSISLVGEGTNLSGGWFKAAS